MLVNMGSSSPIFGGEKFQKSLSCHHPDLIDLFRKHFPPDPITVTEFERFFSQHLEGGLVPNKGNDGSYMGVSKK